MFLGVDGGGTKTGFCLLDPEGRVVATHTTTGCSYLAIGFDAVARILVEGIRRVCTVAGVDVDAIEYAFFGLPCYGESSLDTPRLDAAPSAVLPRERYRCDNDMVCGWAGSLGAVDGINVIAGTGSMTYGERAGHKVRCGGWGELFGDEGSAYWIAVQGLASFSRMSDGRTPRSDLYSRFRDCLNLASDLDLVDLVLSKWHGERARIASCSHIVVEAAAAGDANAIDIIRRAAGELAQLVDTTRRQLGFAADDFVPVSYSGGMFDSGPLFLAAFQASVAQLAAVCALRPPLFSPTVGAALYAAKLHGTPIVVDPVALPPRDTGRQPGGV